MDLQNLLPQQAQPINRVTNGQLPTELAELSEEVLVGDHESLAGSSVIASGSNVLPASWDWSPDACGWVCSYDGDDAE